MTEHRSATEAAPLLDALNIGREARAQASDHSAVKLWLRLLSCSTQIEQLIRSRLRQRFGTTLPRFDYLAQLERHPEGLRMNALSRYLMVSGGNVTGLTDQLVAEGHVERLPDPGDRRSLIVRLTPTGRTHFLGMAAEHEAWLVALFDGFDNPRRQALFDLLGDLRVHLVSRADQPAPPDEPPPTTPARPARAGATTTARKPARKRTP
jgi:DNA-binding MarR family transcriptional regulator